MTRVVAVLSGTSVDAIDVAVADLEVQGDVLVLAPVGAREVALDAGLREAVLDALPPAATSTEMMCRIDAQLGRAFAAAVRETIHEVADGHADLIAMLGQTVHHDVVDGHVRGTLQLGQPAFVAEATGLPVVADLRVRDVAAGGHGAPLVSRLDTLLLADRARQATVAACNLGGIANLTVLGPSQAPIAFDCGPANALLDSAVRDATGAARDEGGQLAARGTVDPALRSALLADPYLRAAPPKSTGKERYNLGYLREALTAAPAIGLADLLATLADAAATAIADDAAHLGVRAVWASGGGVHNQGLFSRLREHLAERGATLAAIEELGLPGDAKEAYAVAVLGWSSWHGLAGTVPSCTGATGPRVLGSITPGAGPLRLPAPIDPATAPRRLLVAAGARRLETT